MNQIGMSLDDYANDPSKFASRTHHETGGCAGPSLVERRHGSAACTVTGANGCDCRAVPRYQCSSSAHIVCGIHVERTGEGLRCPVCRSAARAFKKRGTARA
jgi:hypothetical protein